MKRHLFLACVSTLPFVAIAAPVAAQTEAASPAPVSPPTGTQPAHGTQGRVTNETSTGMADNTLADIIVTANKRSQSINNVGLTITAADASTLADRGVASVADLGKLVPGFTYTESLYSTPVFTLRGIGLYDATFGASPSVSIYTDQIPRNVPVMSQALDLDLDRVEVLKGPQGTLFGQSSTGGAINYILGKPTSSLKYGFDASYESYDKVQASGFVSGPISDTLSARLALRVTNGGDWQYSLSRPRDTNGATRKFEGRVTLDWHPTDRLKVELIGTGVRDRSDVQAPQYLGTLLNTYSTASLAAANANPATRNPYGVVNNALYAGLTTPGSPNYDASLLGRQATVTGRINGSDPVAAANARALLGTPIASGSNRAAEWTNGLLQPSDNYYYQAALRGDYSLNDHLTLTSVTALARQRLSYFQDLDATVAQAVDVPIFGSVATFNQEVRLALDVDGFNGIVGGTYDHLQSKQTNFFQLYDYSGNAPFGAGGPTIGLTQNAFSSTMKSYAGFANAEYKVTPHFTVNGGVRYTENDQTAQYCYSDPLGAGPDQVFSVFEGLFGNPGLPPLTKGQCFPLGDGLNGTTFGKSTRTPVNRSLNEHNWSFRAGANYKFDQGALLYATISQGYKAGIFSAIGASSVSQYASATQEKVISYEAGIKLPLADRKIQLNAAGFYYDYSNKQVRGRINDAVYGLLEKLINVPKSYVLGFEGDVLIRPVDGLTFSASGTYLKSKVSGDFSKTPDGSAVYNSAGYTGNFRGSQLPYTPEFSANADIQYEWTMGAIKPFVGGNLLYQGRENATFNNAALPATDFNIPGYATFDLRAGIEGRDAKWKVSVFGRNVGNKNYTTSVTTYLDTIFRFTGRPSIYGVSFSYRY
uniref:TonB-dependent receptor n=1 Tax=uncultured Sphingomonas sp. TaxID=158754 RepID=UPI0035C9575E